MACLPRSKQASGRLVWGHTHRHTHTHPHTLGKRTSRVGTPCYLAPEILYNDAYAEPVDIWGLGCIFYEMLTFDFLWERRGMLGAVVIRILGLFYSNTGSLWERRGMLGAVLIRILGLFYSHTRSLWDRRGMLGTDPVCVFPKRPSM